MMPVIRAERRGSGTSPTSFYSVRLVGITAASEANGPGWRFSETQKTKGFWDKNR